MEQFKSLDYLLFLNSLGTVVALDIYVNPEKVLSDVKAFESQWKLYNRHKTGNKRWGLSLTSLDGGFSGDPDLYSLKDYNELHSTDYKEYDFNIPTPALLANSDLINLTKLFPDLGRTHLLRLDKGGFFPPHRDNAFMEPECFRLFACLDSNYNHYSMVIDDRQYFFKAGLLYLINTTLSHSLVSFYDSTYFLVLNVPLNKSNVDSVIGNLCQN